MFMTPAPTRRDPARRAGPRAVLGLALVLGTSGLLGACSDNLAAHGNLPTTESMGQIEAGAHTRGDVQALLGTPSATSMFGGETWYYISSLTEQVAFMKPDELSRKVIAIQFDPSGTVTEVRTLEQADGRDVDIVQRETPTRGTEATIIQELFGNIGRFAPNTDNL